LLPGSFRSLAADDVGAEGANNVGFCTLYADAAMGTLLGAHIMGDQASLLIQPLIQAAATGQQVADMARNQYWIHPALSEVMENALLKLHRSALT
jgi:mycothione reductase